MGGLVGGVKVGRSRASLPLLVEVERLSPPEDFLVSLERHLLLVYTGKTRLARNLLQVRPPSVPGLTAVFYFTVDQNKTPHVSIRTKPAFSCTENSQIVWTRPGHVERTGYSVGGGAYIDQKKEHVIKHEVSASHVVHLYVQSVLLLTPESL